MRKLIGFLCLFLLAGCGELESKKELRCYVDLNFLDSVSLSEYEINKLKVIIDNNYENYRGLKVFSYEYYEEQLNTLNMEFLGECVRHRPFIKKVLSELRKVKSENLIMVNKIIEGWKIQSITYNQK